ncbi:MAG: phosphatidate cytidylyltransferase [Lachnospiraceae bacterium]|nr:phosphatidate cytidylyltransferase [Lachnospiraceae bacterium]
MFKTRLISGIVLVIILAVALILGRNILWCLTLLISLVGMFELNRVLHNEKNILGMISYLMCILYYICLMAGETKLWLLIADNNYYEIVSLTLLICIMAVYVFGFPKFKAVDVCMTYFGFFYVAVMLSFIYKIRMVEDVGIYIVWLVFICSWVCDTCAYCVGMLVGKHKLAPKLSPKKSVEGSLGGIAGSVFVGAIYGFALQSFLTTEMNPAVMFALIGAAGAVISQIGDLAASAIKRNYQVKDYGTLIPGHGGILDRFDSVIATAPIIYFLFVVLA